MTSKSTQKWNATLRRYLKSGLDEGGNQVLMKDVTQFERDMFRNLYPFGGKKQNKKRQK